MGITSSILGDQLAPFADPPGRAQVWAVRVAFAASIVWACMLFGLAPVRFAGMSRALWAEGTHWLIAVAPISLAAVACLTAARWSALFAMSYGMWRRNLHELTHAPSRWPTVSILVPAYNEAETIGLALSALLELDYPAYEVIVIDDGSNDRTFELASQLEGRHRRCRIRVLHKTNGGKWSALNYGYWRSTGELLLCLDADSQVLPDVLRLMVRRLADPKVAAVAGQVRVRNRMNVLTRLQAMEYLMGNGAVRMAQGRSQTVLVVPGPIGLFRRVVLEEVCIRFGLREAPEEQGRCFGPFEPDTFAEDFDLSLTILALGGNIVYEPRAVSNTKAPDWPAALISQRYRWMRGSMQVLKKYLRRARTDARLRRRRVMAWIAATYFYDLLFQPFVYLSAAVFGSVYLVGGAPVAPLLAYTLLFQLLNVGAGTMYILMHNDDLKLLHILPFYDFYQGGLLNAALAIAAVDEVRRVPMRW